MSKITILHDYRLLSIKNENKVTDEEYVIQGEKGLKIKYYHKDDKVNEKIVVTGKDGQYKMKTTIDKNTTEKDLDDKGLKAELKGKLKFAKDLITLKGGSNDLEGGVRRRSSKKSGSKKSGSKKSGSKKSGSKKSGVKK